MPKISDEKRAARRVQILEAAWTCFQKQGLHATTMSDIIAASGLSAGAVYSYFSGKEDLILAAVTTSLGGLRALVEPSLRAPSPPPPDRFIEEIAQAIVGFTARDGYDLRRIALLGWSEAQRNERLRDVMQGYYLAFRVELADTVVRWKRAGEIRNTASAPDVAKAMLSAILGFVVQSAILGDVAPKDLGRGLRDLIGCDDANGG